jgi:hypothetical protein
MQCPPREHSGKLEVKAEPRAYDAPRHHFHSQATVACLELSGPDRYGAVVFKPRTGFAPRQVSRPEIAS